MLIHQLWCHSDSPNLVPVVETPEVFPRSQTIRSNDMLQKDVAATLDEMRWIWSNVNLSACTESMVSLVWPPAVTLRKESWIHDLTQYP